MEISKVINGLSELTVKVAIGAAVGGIAAAMIPSIGVPVATGAVFCGTMAIIIEVADKALSACQIKGLSKESRILASVVTVLVGTAITAGIATLAGFPITVSSGLAIVGVAFLAFFTAGIFWGVLMSITHEQRRVSILY